MKNAFKKTSAFVLSLALAVGALPANAGGFLTGITASAASSAETEEKEPVDPATVVYDGVTYYNVYSTAVDSELAFYKDLLFTKSAELGGYSIADLWIIFAAGTDKDADDFSEKPKIAKEYIDKNYKVEAPYWSDNDNGLGFCVAQNNGWRYKVIFTDFKVTAMLPDDDGMNYVSTTITKDDSSDKQVIMSGLENRSSKEQSKKVRESMVKTSTVSHSTNKKVGAEVSSTIEVGTTVKCGVVEGNEKVTFSAKASAEASWSNSEQASCEISEESEISLSAPPYTALLLSNEVSNITMKTRYNCPLALSYNVTLYTTSPSNKDKKLCSFGVDGYDAIGELKKRAEDGSIKNADRENLPWLEKNILGNPITKYAFDKITTHAPMATVGATFTQSKDTKTTTFYDYTPLYPLSAVRSDINEVSMQIGDIKKTSDFKLTGYAVGTSGVEAPYYGFDPKNGYWIVIDKNGNEYAEADSPVIVKKDQNTGVTEYEAVKTGTAYLKYMIDENSYTSSDQPSTYTKNANLRSTATIKVTVTDDTSKPKVTASKAFTGIVGADAVYLDDYFDVEFVDETGKDMDYYWEAKETKKKGIVFDDDNNVYFTKPGTFHVRVRYEDTYSDWVEITAEVYGNDWVAPEDEQEPFVDADYSTSFKFTGSYTGLVGAEPDAIEGEPSAPIKQTEDGKEFYSHGRLQVDAFDNTDKEIIVDKTWEAMETEGITITEDGKVSFTEPGTYHVCVKSGDFYSDWYEITAAETSEEYSTISFFNADGTLLDSIAQPWGSAVTAPSDPTMKGYIFKGWSAEVPETMPADSIELTAQWEIDESVEHVLITGSVRGSGCIEASTDGSDPVFDDEHPMKSLYYNTVKGESVIFSAKADEGWEFAEWQERATGKTYSTDATITITADTPLDLLAVFKEKGAATHKLTDAELIQWTLKDYQDKTGTAANAAITSWSDDGYNITLTDDNDMVLDTYTVNPDTGIGTNAAGEEVNLPQTGMSGAHKAFAGLAALMTIAGFGLVKKSRKENEE